MRKLNKSVTVVEEVCFSVKEGEVFSLVGESGCGKTLTALSVLKLLPENITAEGSIFFQNGHHRKDLLSLTDEEIRHIRGKEIGMVFQEPMTSLNPVLTIKDQIIEPLLVHEGISSSEAVERAEVLLKRMGFKEPQRVMKSYPHQLSGGMRQRVMLCMALICNPKLLIADEPTTALDVTIQAEIMSLLEDIQSQRRLSVLLISHNLALVYEISHRVGIMYAGSIVEEAKTEELFERPLHPYTRGLLESIPSERGRPLRPIPGSVPPPERWPSGCRFAPRCQFSTKQCSEARPALEKASSGHLVRCFRWREI
ncbi:MAG: ABC transporter ATP-binding protein [Nitrospirae bacterium]|nr:MAG: ABC transporter ATP-binding protein [Nitrospirota bacterium]